MKCHDIKTLLISFLEGELTTRRSAEVASHLETCASCRQEKELLIQTWQMLDHYAAPKVKDDFTSNLLRKIHADEAVEIKVRYELPWFTLRPLVPALASVFVVIVIFSLYWRQPTQESPSIKITPTVTELTPISATDREIIKNLDILENADLLKNMQLLSDLDVLENMEETPS